MILLSLTGLSLSRSNRLHFWLHRSVRSLRCNDTVPTSTVAFTVIAAVVAMSCDPVPLTSPTRSTILLSASTNIVPIDGSAEITATVTESANTAVQNGTTVVFRAEQRPYSACRRRRSKLHHGARRTIDSSPSGRHYPSIRHRRRYKWGASVRCDRGVGGGSGLTSVSHTC